MLEYLCCVRVNTQINEPNAWNYVEDGTDIHRHCTTLYITEKSNYTKFDLDKVVGARSIYISSRAKYLK